MPILFLLSLMPLFVSCGTTGPADPRPQGDPASATREAGPPVSGTTSDAGGASGQGGAGRKPTPRLVQVSATEGTVLLQKSATGKEMNAIAGMNLATADTLVTAAKSTSLLNVDNDKTVDVWQNVRMTVMDILGSVDTSDDTSRVILETGKIYVRIQRKLAPGETFEVQTPTCILGVRGTEFLVSVDGAVTELYVIEGTVEGRVNLRVQDPDGGTRQLDLPFRVSAGEWTRLEDTIRNPRDILVRPLTRDILPSFVLTSVRAHPERAPAAFLDGIDEAIAAQLRLEENPPAVPAGRVVTNPWNGHRYLRIDRTGDSFPVAAAACVRMGGHLATISGEREQAFLESLTAGQPERDYWIGLYQASSLAEPDGGWRWVTEEPMAYLHWDRTALPGEPDNRYGMESAAVLHHGYREGLWNDVPPSDTRYGWICEWDAGLTDTWTASAALRETSQSASEPPVESVQTTPAPSPAQTATPVASGKAPPRPTATPVPSATQAPARTAPVTQTPSAAVSQTPAPPPSQTPIGMQPETTNPFVGIVVPAETATPTPEPSPEVAIVNPFLVSPLLPARIDTSMVTLENVRKVCINQNLAEVEAFLGTSKAVTDATLPAGAAEIRRWGSSTKHIDAALSTSGYVVSRTITGITLPAPIEADLSSAPAKNNVVAGIALTTAYEYLGTDVYDVTGVYSRRTATTTWTYEWLDVGKNQWTLSVVNGTVTKVLYSGR